MDNIPKLIEIKNKQNKDTNFKIKPTALYTLNQNNVAEKVI